MFSLLLASCASLSDGAYLIGRFSDDRLYKCLIPKGAYLHSINCNSTIYRESVFVYNSTTSSFKSLVGSNKCIIHNTSTQYYDSVYYDNCNISSVREKWVVTNSEKYQ